MYVSFTHYVDYDTIIKSATSFVGFTSLTVDDTISAIPVGFSEIFSTINVV